MSSIIRGYSEEETAEILRVKVQTLAVWRSKGTGPRYRKIGKTVEYTDEFIREFQDACVRVPEKASIRRQRRALAAEAVSPTSSP
jgi:hypothetical protein